jgi:uncharacterized protein (DUF1501 family)
MKTTRRQFIKRTGGAISIALLAPRFLMGQSAAADTPASHRVLVVLQLGGGNDGLNTVVPYSDPQYRSLRPMLGFTESELADTVIDGNFAFHPQLKELKQMYSDGKVAVVLGVGYPTPDLSHDISTSIWQSANPNNGTGFGWLGRYADAALDSSLELPAAAIGANYPPKIISAQKSHIPLVARIGDSAFRTRFNFDRDMLIKAFRDLNGRDFPPDQLIGQVSATGAAAEHNGGLLEMAVASYHSTVQYQETNVAAQALKSAAILINAFPDATVVHVSYPAALDTHATQIGSTADGFTNRLIGTHATEMQRLSQAIKAFYDDMTGLGFGDNVVLMTYSEFGRRPNENGSHGTDHGTASNLFVVGNPVKGGALYGKQPTLDPATYDSAGNVKFTTDFRSVYATLLDRWMPRGNSQQTLGSSFDPIDFL